MKKLPAPISTQNAWSAIAFGGSMIAALVLIIWRTLLS